MARYPRIDERPGQNNQQDQQDQQAQQDQRDQQGQQGQEDQAERQRGDLRGTGLLPPGFEEDQRRDEEQGQQDQRPQEQQQDQRPQEQQQDGNGFQFPNFPDLGQGFVPRDDLFPPEDQLPPDTDPGGPPHLDPPDLSDDAGDEIIDLINRPPFGLGQTPGARVRSDSDTDKKRRLTVSQNILDPLSAWYHSQHKLGNYQGIRYSQISVMDDPRLKINDRDSNYGPPVQRGLIGSGLLPPDLEEDLLTQRTLQANFQWSLAPLRGQAEPAEFTTREDFILFLRALNPEIQNSPAGRQEEFMSGNPYMYFAEPIEGIQQDYRSMPVKMFAVVLNTSRKILDVFNPEFPHGNSATGAENRLLSQFEEITVTRFRQLNPPILIAEEAPEVQAFFDKLIVQTQPGIPFGRRTTFQQALDDYRRFCKRTVVATGEPKSLVDIIREIVSMISSNTDIDTNNQTLCRYILVDAFSPIADPYTLLQIIEDPIMSKTAAPYKHNYLEIETPYITTRNTYNFLKDGLESNFVASIKSDYNFYAEMYEDLFDAGIIEAVGTELPNVYALNLFLNLHNKENKSLGEQREYNKLGKYLSLYGRVSDLAGIARLEGEFYYNTYAKALPNVPPDLVSELNDFYTPIIIEGDQLKNTQVFNSTPPMSLGVQYHRSDTSVMDNLLNKVGFPQMHELLMENIIRKPNDLLDLGHDLYKTEYLVQNTSGIYEAETDFRMVRLRKYDFDWYTEPLQNPPYPQKMHITKDFSLIGSAVSRLQAAAGQHIANNLESGIVDVINGNNSKGTSLGYRIEKRPTNDDTGRVQNIYLGTGGELTRDVIYTDSQIEYDKEYSYDLYEYRWIFAHRYKCNILASNRIGEPSTIPPAVMGYYLGVMNVTNAIFDAGRAPNMIFSSWLRMRPDHYIAEVPIYAERFANFSSMTSIEPGVVNRQRSPFDNPSGLDLEINTQVLTSTPLMESIVYPPGKVLDYPPTPPIMDVFPLVGNSGQVKISVNLQTGALLGEEAIEIVSIGDNTDQIIKVKNYQDNFKNIFLPPNVMEFKNEGIAEVQRVHLYRTTDLDLEVENYNEIYASFNRPPTLVRSYSTDPDDPRAEEVAAYDILENIQSNVNYYYTCVVEDVHGNFSNPSIIYRVRILFDKGLIIPEIGTVLPVGQNIKTPSKNLTRFVKIEASDIQTFPVVEDNVEGEYSNQRSVAVQLGNSIEGNSYIVRFTSKDTGRKFDLKLNFVVRVDGEAINIGT